MSAPKTRKTPLAKKVIKSINDGLLTDKPVSIPNQFKGRTIPNNLPYDIVGTFRLKRSKINEATDRKVGFFMSDDTFMQLNQLGMKYGVTFDEILKGLTDRELADVNGGSTLSHWIPVLNL